jgi:protein BCP1
MLRSILAPDASSHVGFVFSERLVNMPVEVVPHMYRMLADEMQWACDDGEPYNFSHLLMLSRTYTLHDEESEAGITSYLLKKRRKCTQTQPNAGGVFTFHHEDQCIQEVSHALSTPPCTGQVLNLIEKLASYSLNYPLSNSLPREKESFGLEQGGCIMLLTADQLPQLISNLATTFPQPSP